MAAAIIAGGKGSRLGGVDKTALVVGGRTILERQLEVLRGRFSRVVLAVGESAPAAVPADVVVVRDRTPGAGPLAGLEAVLAALAPEEEAAVCVAADMPLISAAPVELLRDAAPGAEALVPLVGGQPEPLFARYHRSCAPAVAAALREGRWKTMGLLSSVRVQWIAEATLRAADADLACLLNVNTPEDLTRAERLLGT